MYPIQLYPNFQPGLPPDNTISPPRLDYVFKEIDGSTQASIKLCDALRNEKGITLKNLRFDLTTTDISDETKQRAREAFFHFPKHVEMYFCSLECPDITIIVENGAMRTSTQGAEIWAVGRLAYGSAYNNGKVYLMKGANGEAIGHGKLEKSFNVYE